VFGLVSVGGTGIWLARTRMHATKAPETPSASVETPANPPVTSFVLHLDSDPSGAAVSEDGNVLGTTPIDIKIDRSSVATSQRSFQLKKDGFVTTVYAQKDADSRVEQQVDLTAEPTAKAGKTPHGQGGKAAGKTPPVTTGSDIRLQR